MKAMVKPTMRSCDERRGNNLCNATHEVVVRFANDPQARGDQVKVASRHSKMLQVFVSIHTPVGDLKCGVKQVLALVPDCKLKSGTKHPLHGRCALAACGVRSRGSLHLRLRLWGGGCTASKLAEVTRVVMMGFANADVQPRGASVSGESVEGRGSYAAQTRTMQVAVAGGLDAITRIQEEQNGPRAAGNILTGERDALTAAVEAFNNDDGVLLENTLSWAPVLIMSSTVQLSDENYDSDPAPDFGGSVDGWTNTVYDFGGVQLGTSDDICAHDGDNLLALVEKNIKACCRDSLIKHLRFWGKELTFIGHQIDRKFDIGILDVWRAHVIPCVMPMGSSNFLRTVVVPRTAPLDLSEHKHS